MIVLIWLLGWFITIVFGDYEKLSTLYHTFYPICKTNTLTPLTKMWWESAELMFMSLHVEHCEGCIERVDNALSWSKKVGIHHFDMLFVGFGLVSALSIQDFKAFDQYLEQLNAVTPFTSLIKHQYHVNLAGKHLCLEEYDRAKEQAIISLEYSKRMKTPYVSFFSNLVLAYASFQLGYPEVATTALAEAEKIVDPIVNYHYKSFLHLFQAYMFYKTGHDSEGEKKLIQAISALKSRGNTIFLLCARPALSYLCQKALLKGIEKQYVQNLISKAQLFPDTIEGNMQEWPFPLKIQTFDQFKLWKNNQPVQFSKKIPQKPLMLLKVLIALGGKDVSETQISDIIWPDVDGDAAYSAFTTTLQRLRKIIGIDQVIVLQQGKISLDERYCWVDTWAFKHLCSDIKRFVNSNSDHSKKNKIQLYQQAIDLYRGPFLNDQSRIPCFAVEQERLKNHYITLILEMGNVLEHSEQWEKASDIYEIGLKADHLVEEFYQCILFCCQKLGQRTKGIFLFNHCKNVFKSTLDIKPSTKTHQLYTALINDNMNN